MLDNLKELGVGGNIENVLVPELCRPFQQCILHFVEPFSDLRDQVFRAQGDAEFLALLSRTIPTCHRTRP